MDITFFLYPVVVVTLAFAVHLTIGVGRLLAADDKARATQATTK